MAWVVQHWLILVISSVVHGLDPSGCLLQNQFFNDRMQIASEDFKTVRNKFAETEFLEREVLEKALEQSITQHQEHVAYGLYLRRQMTGLIQATQEISSSHDSWLKQRHRQRSTVPAKANVSFAAVWDPANANMQAILDRHNQYRCMHGVPPLAWNDELASHAAEWARTAEGKMVHSSDENRTNVAGFGMLGENLARGGGRYTSTGGVDEWHKEILLTDNGTGTVSQFSLAVGHYTALVWKDTTDVGCGVYQRLLVCQYGPIGNTKGLFSSHVLPITKNASECGVTAYKDGIILDDKNLFTKEDPRIVKTQEVEGKSVSDIVSKFINTQVNSEDSCHAQILEAKHQLNDVAQLAVDLFHEINATEEQIKVADVGLQEKLRQLTELENRRQQELEKCQQTKTAATNMYATLKEELEEMKQIANPDVALDVTTGKLHKVAFAQEVVKMLQDQHAPLHKVALAQEGVEELQDIQGFANHWLATAVDHVGNEQIQHHHVHPASLAKSKIHQQPLHGGSPNFGNATLLIKAVHKASLSFKSCMRAASHSAQVSLTNIDVRKPKLTTEECEDQKAELAKVYVKAYVELARMLKENEEVANSTACFDSAENQYVTQKDPLQADANRFASTLSELNGKLQTLRPELDDVKKAEEKVRGQVDDLAWDCGEVAPTASDLDKVRDAIHAMGKCPGISRVKFFIPRWTGSWASFTQDAMSQDDEAQDKAMNLACQKMVKGSRAAEVDELQERSVDGIPETNTAPNPLLGVCPNCQGKKDESFASGHARVCWDPGKPLTLAQRSGSCGMGRKAVLCVVEESVHKQ